MNARLQGIAIVVGVGVGLLGGGCDLVDPQVGAQNDSVCVDADSDPSHPVSYMMQIVPLMNRTDTDSTGHGCSACHYTTMGSGLCIGASGLDLTTYSSMVAGGNYSHGTMVIPGMPCESAFVQKLQGTFPIGVRMPKDGPPYWSDDQIQLVIDWIYEGAKNN